MSDKINDASSYALDHSHHRQRLRQKFQQSQGAFMTDITLLELLYNGYYPRNETNSIARDRLSTKSLSELMHDAEKQDRSFCSLEELYLTVCANMMFASDSGSNLPPIFSGLKRDQIDLIFDRLYPFFLCDKPRMAYLGFNRFDELKWCFFSLFGEDELPIGLSHCHLKQLKYVIFCVSVDSVPSEQLLDGIRYYLRKMEYCPRIWKLCGILFRHGGTYTYLSVEDEKEGSGGIL